MTNPNDIKIKPGNYVVAVSGGVDSMVLLHQLRNNKHLELIVAHLDHGIRPDSHLDARLVKEMAATYRLPCDISRVELGSDISEAEARRQRYAFLRRIQKKHRADAIITAHHQDDVVETAIINLIRGTRHRGLISLSSTKDILRPLLHTSKDQLIRYAKEHHLRWREDTTNSDQTYLRNYIRKTMLAPLQRRGTYQELVELINRQRDISSQLLPLLHNLHDELFDESGQLMRRAAFTTLPHNVACEVIRRHLDLLDSSHINQTTIENMVQFCKTASPAKRLDVSRKLRLIAETSQVRFQHNF